MKPTKHHINIGFDHTVKKNRIVAILNTCLLSGNLSAPLKKLKAAAADKGLLINATNGRRTRSLIVTDSYHVIQSAVTTETLWERYGKIQ